MAEEIPETDVAEETPSFDKVLSRISSLLEYFGQGSKDTGSRFGTAEANRAVQAPPPEMPEPAPVEEAAITAPEQETGVLNRLAGSERTPRSEQTLDAARAAVDNYRNSRRQTPYDEDLV